MFKDCSRRAYPDKITMNGGGSEGKILQWGHADINAKQNPANADSGITSSALRLSNTPVQKKIAINMAFVQASDNMMVDSCMRRLAKGEADDSPLPDEKSNRSAPAARLFQENFQSQFNAAMAI